MHATNAESPYTHRKQINMVFANCSKEDLIDPLTVKEIAQAQKDNTVLKKLSTHDKDSTQGRGYTQVLCKDGKMVTPSQFFRTKQLAGTSTTCSILGTPVLKREYMQ